MARKTTTSGKIAKQVTRYKYDEIRELRTPETGHTPLLPADGQVVTLPMDNGWSKAIGVGKLPEGDERPVVVDMDPAADPVLFWAGKRNRREVPVLPLQANEIVSESRISQIIERAGKAAEEKSGVPRQGHLFADLDEELHESERTDHPESVSPAGSLSRRRTSPPLAPVEPPAHVVAACASLPPRRGISNCIGAASVTHGRRRDTTQARDS